VGAPFLGAVLARVTADRPSTRRAAGKGPVPLAVVNDTGAFPNSAVWVYVVGTDPATGLPCHALADGTLVPCRLSDNDPNGVADYAIPMAPGGATTVALPRMSGRVYVSLQRKLAFSVAAAGVDIHVALRHPAGWAASDPNFGILYDSVEFTHDDAGMVCNTTTVDMFSVPLAIQLEGTRTQTAGTLVPGGRERIFAEIAAVPAFARLVVGDRLRLIAPGHGIEAGLFPSTYFDGYVDDVWRRYRARSLVVTTAAGEFSGRVDPVSGALAFTGPGAVRPFTRPSTRDVLFCDGTLAAPGGGATGQLAAVIAAGLNRSTLRDVPAQPTADPAGFYRQPVTNHYSRVIHANTADGRAYGFARDDVAGAASVVHDSAPAAMTLTLTPF
jgi:hypothetical protein